MDNKALESISLQLLRDVRTELGRALDSLYGQPPEGLLHAYYRHSAVYIERAVEAYIYVRESGRLEASKLFVRTALEVFIRIQAVRKKPELMFRIAFTEFEEDKKWGRARNRPDIKGTLKAIDSQWQIFRQAYRAKYPQHAVAESELSLWSAAELAGLSGYYDSHYRLYCRFTHAAFRAMSDNLNGFETEDNRAMTLCAIAAVDALAEIGAASAHLPALKDRLSPK